LYGGRREPTRLYGNRQQRGGVAGEHTLGLVSCRIQPLRRTTVVGALAKFEAKGLPMYRTVDRTYWVVGWWLLASLAMHVRADEWSPPNPPLAGTRAVANVDVSGLIRVGDASEPTRDDFADQGEYASGVAGVVTATGSSLGLQMVALGDGQFRAALLPGGLPGNGWTRGVRIELIGQRDGDRIVLKGDDHTVSVDGGRAELTSTKSGERFNLIKVVRRSPYFNLVPPPGSYVLFDGQDTVAWRKAKIKDGQLQAGTELIPTFRNFQMHVEFLVPYMPGARGQGRGNSGVYLQSRYEVQVLDSFGLVGAFNECGALYRQRAPDLNMAFPPLSWQTYDITFHSPRFDVCGRKHADARLTLLHNGIAVHKDIAIKAKTGAGSPEGPQSLPIKLQDHGNPVYFRNIWLLELP
jgi:hypothetical protein